MRRTRSASATIEGVAARAGVSRQTVSNVLNAPERVSPHTAERVRRAIAELHYRPHWAARRLRTRTSRTIGFRIQPSGPPVLGSLIDRFLHALTSQAWNAGYRLLLFTQASGDDERATYDELSATGTVDGFVIYDLRIGDRRPPWLAQRSIPFACFGRPLGSSTAARYAWVDVDGALGIAQAVDYAVSRGHRRIAYLGWHPGTCCGDDREQGWHRAMRRHRLDTAGLHSESADELAAGTDAARRLLAGDDPPTAFVCASDTLAVGARLASQVGVQVVGFDDSPVVSLLQPPMSSVRQPLEDVARAIVRLLLEQLDGNTTAEGVLLPPQLIVRDGQQPAGQQKIEKSTGS